MNHEPFDEHLSWELRALVADADPPPTLRPAASSRRVMPRPFILIGSVAAAVAVIAALLVAPGGGGDHRQHVAAEGGTTTSTTENGVIVPVPGDQSTPSSVAPTTTTTEPRRSTTTLPVIHGRPTTTSSVPPKPLSMTRYSLDGWYWAITEGGDGNMWAIDGLDVARISPNGQVTKFALNPPPKCGPPCIEEGITAGPDGNVWFTEDGNKIGRITPSGQITEFATPASGRAITTGPDGALWFTAGPQVGRITTAGSVTMFPVPPTASGIARGSDGNLWFAATNYIGRMTPAGVLTQYPMQHPYQGATLGSDGNVWFQSDSGGDTVARVSPSGDVTEFSGARGSQWASAIAGGPDGNVWCLQDFHEAPAPPPSTSLGVFRADRSGKVTAFTHEPADQQFGIASGPGGTLWVTFTAGDGFSGVAKFSPPTS